MRSKRTGAYSSIGLCAWRKAVELGQLMRTFHPPYALRDLDVRSRRHGFGIIIGRTLNIDDPGQHLLVNVE